MARCIDCAWFPWRPGADLSGLPAMRCHPDTPMRRWSNVGAEAETTCERYQAVDGDKAIPEKAPDIIPGEPPATDATPVGVLTDELHTQDAPPPDETPVEPPTEEPEGQDATPPEASTPEDAPQNPEEAPAAAETKSGTKGKGKKGSSKQKKGD